MKIWDTGTKSSRDLRGNEEVDAMAFSPNGNLIACGSIHGSVRFCRPKIGQNGQLTADKPIFRNSEYRSGKTSASGHTGRANIRVSFP
jgi:hypothetical protein